MTRSVRFVLAGVAAATFCGAANADTLATFADPSPGGAMPLFSYQAGILSGSWLLPGLTLQTPGLAAPDFPNATFVMTPLATIVALPGVTIMFGGSIQFFDQLNTPILNISFAGATLTNGISFGASDFVGQNVTISGSIVPYPVTQDAFAFSFANPVGSVSQFTATAAFTSSGTLDVPAPASAALFGLAGLSVTRRRRK